MTLYHLVIIMNENLNLNQLEKKTASLIYQDGIFDMTLGLALIVFGIAYKLNEVWPETKIVLFMLGLYAIIATPLFLIQVLVTKPRLGVVKYSTQRKRKQMAMIVAAASLLIANIVAFILITTGVFQFSGDVYLMAVIFGLVPFLAFIIMAYLLDFKRLYLIGALFSIGIFLLNLFAIQNLDLIGTVTIIGLGIGIMAIGAVYLVLFLKKYPKITGQEHEFQETRNK